MHKKYTYKGGKRFGPYYYENKRVNGKVVTRYLGSTCDGLEKLEKKGGVLPYVVIGLIVLFVVLFLFSGGIFTGFDFRETGRVVVETELVYELGEPLRGNLRFNIKEGELVPLDSKILVDLGNQSREYLITDLITEEVLTGGYYAEDVELSGGGEGYGVLGQKLTYPDVQFVLRVVDEGKKEKEEKEKEEEVEINVTRDASEEEEEIISNESRSVKSSEDGGGVGDGKSESDVEEEGVGDEAEGSLSVDEEIVDDEVDSELEGDEEVVDSGVAEESEETDEDEAEEGEDESSEDESEDDGESVITGEAIGEDEYTLNVLVNKDLPFSYTIEKGQTAEIVDGSVSVNGESVDESAVSLNVDGESVRAETDYFLSEEGFGKEYLGEFALALRIDFDDLGFVAEEGTLNVKLIYGDVEIAFEDKEISVNAGVEDVLVLKGNASVETESLELIKDIPLIRIAKGGTTTIDLGNYFSGAEKYEINDMTNVTEEVKGNLLVLTPEGGFSGARSGRVVGIAGEERVESNGFSVLVSSGAVKIKTSRKKIRVGESVKWIKNVSLDVPEEKLSVELPISAENVSVKKINAGGVQEAQASVGITGQVTIDIDLQREPAFIRWLKRIFGAITGRVVSVEEVGVGGNVEVVLEDDATEYLIEYETEPPLAVEEEIDEGKVVQITGPDDVLYEDVIAFTELDGRIAVGKESDIKIYWYNYEYESFDKKLKEVDEVDEEKTVEDVVEGIVGDVVGVGESAQPPSLGQIGEISNDTVEGIITNESLSVEDGDSVVSDGDSSSSDGVINSSGDSVEGSEEIGGVALTGGASNEANGSENVVIVSNGFPSILGRAVDVEVSNPELTIQPSEGDVGGGEEEGIDGEEKEEEGIDGEEKEAGEVVTVFDRILGGNEDEEEEVRQVGNISIIGREGVDYVRQDVPFDTYDLNGDGFLDYMEWVVPHLSDQTYEIVIEITHAEHLDSERVFLSDIFEEVKALDGVWSEAILDREYVRVRFEENLTNDNDITVYPRILEGSPRVEVYEINGSEVIAEFESLDEDKYNKVFLDGSSGFGLGEGSQDRFDLRVLEGSVEFDHIIDPTTVSTGLEQARVQTIAPLGNDSFVLGWCSDSDLHITFAVYNTSGAVITSDTDVDTSVAKCSSFGDDVRISAFNSTTFVVGWYDDNQDDVSFAVYDFDGNVKVAETDVDTDVGTSGPTASVSVLNETGFVIGWADDSGDNIEFAIYDISGTLITGPINVDGLSTQCCYATPVAALNSTTFVMGWFEANVGDFHFRLYDYLGNNLSASTVTIDSDSKSGHSLSIAPFNESTFIAAWDDGNSDHDASFKIYDVAGNELVAETDVDTNIRGSRLNGYSVTSAVINESTFVISWWDDADHDASFAIYDSAGNEIVAERDVFKMGGLALPSAHTQTVAAYNHITNISICDNNFIMAWTRSDKNTEWQGFNSNGVEWTGICSGPTPPDISNPEVNVSNKVAINEMVKVNASVTAGDNAIGNVTIQIEPPQSAIYNVTAVQSGNEFYNDTIVLNELGIWNFTFFANDSSGNNSVSLKAMDKQGYLFVDVRENSVSNFAANDDAEDVSLALLNGTLYVSAWCDEINDDITFAVYDVSGSEITAAVDVDSDSGNCDSVYDGVEVSALNASSFVIAWVDGTDKDITYRVYDYSGTALVAETDVDTDVGGVGKAVSVSAFNSTIFVIGWSDDSDQDSTFGVYDIAGNTITAATDADTAVGGNSYSTDVEAFNSTTFVISWIDSADQDLTFAVYDFQGNEIVSATDVDTTISTSRVADVSVMNSSAFVLGWMDRGDTDASFRTYWVNGSPISEQGDIDTTIRGDNLLVGENTIVVQAINDTDFLFSWNDDSDDTLKNLFAVFQYDGTEVIGETEVEVNLFSNEVRPIGLASYQAATGTGICDDRVLIGWASSEEISHVLGYYANGTEWNGVCSGAESDTTGPSVTINFPKNKTYGILDLTFNFNVSLSENGSVIYSLDGGVNNISMLYSVDHVSVFGDEFNSSNSSISSGGYTFSVYANDSVGNKNNTENITFSVDSDLPGFSPVPLDETVDYNSWGGADFNGTDATTSVTGYHVNDSLFTINASGFLNGSSRLAAGTYGLNVTLNDSLNNTNFTVYTLTLNKISSVVNLTINETQGNLTTLETSLPINVTVKLGDNTTDLKLFNNGTLINVGNNSIGNLTTFTTGLKNITGIFEESENYTSSSEEFYLNVSTVEIVPPNVTIIFPGNTTYGTNDLPLRFNVSLNEAADRIVFSLDGGVNNLTGSDFGNNYYVNDTNNSIASGGYVFTVVANDSVGNKNNTENITFSVDVDSPIVTINFPASGGSYKVGDLPLNFNVSLSENSSVLYSLNSGKTNLSMFSTDEFSLFGQLFNDTNDSIADGDYTFSVYANDTTGNNNYTENVTFSFSAAVAGATGSSTSSFVGGGSATLPAEASISTSLDFVNFNVIQGQGIGKEVIVTNNGNKSIILGLEVFGLEELLSVPDVIKLGAGESQVINISLGTVIDPGLLTGKVLLSVNKVVIKEILLAVNVKSGNFLFDPSISLIGVGKKVNIGETLRYQVDLLQVGPEVEVEVAVTYVIKDFRGVVFAEESETIFVSGEKSFLKEISAEELPAGNYVLGLEVVYPGAFAVSSTQFEVVDRAGKLLVWEIAALFLAGIFVVGFIIALFVKLRRLAVLKWRRFNHSKK